MTVPGLSPERAARYPSLAGRRVIVTGGGQGIGAAFVEAFARQGCAVAFLDVAEAPSRELEHRLAYLAAAPRFIACDLKDAAAIATHFAAIEAAWGGVIDVLINNAGNDDRHRLEEVTPEYWEDRMAVNLRHQFFCAQAAAPAMRRAGRGVILNLGSISWHLGLDGIVLYETAKAGVEGMTRALARELGRDGIRVSALVPGNVDTPRQRALWYDGDGVRAILEAQCIPERVQPEDVAAMALFLASDDARLCTGHTYWVDAGWR